MIDRLLFGLRAGIAFTSGCVALAVTCESEARTTVGVSSKATVGVSAGKGTMSRDPSCRQNRKVSSVYCVRHVGHIFIAQNP